ncbi:MAG: hypothetical protein CLLPBCKN_004509 [Chroococcidiopsis cubana SAG 39.79]|nr:hypothetical protein [Chroococcidiopsis cubana SAG 39.79]
MHPIRPHSEPVIATSGAPSKFASATPVIKLVAPDPREAYSSFPVVVRKHPP